MRRGSTGFTLMEMLVVISVIALLGALLLPAFSGAREQVRKSVCMSNLRSIGAAMDMYLQDHDGIFLPARYTDYSWTGRTKAGQDIDPPLEPYLRNRGVERCPSDSSAWFPTGGHFPTSYAWSWKLSDQSAASVRYPASVVTFNEVWAFHMGRYSRCYDPYFECLGVQAGNEVVLLFADNHVHYTRNRGTNSISSRHDWRTEYYNVLPDDLGQNSYDVR